MSAFNYYKEAFTKKFADFNGRARRSEFWYFTLFNTIVAVVLNLIDGVTGMPILGGIYSLAALIPGIAVGVRRLHDTGKSGWWYLIAFTIIGIIPLIVFWAMDSTSGSNKFGANPKGIGSDQPADHLISDEA